MNNKQINKLLDNITYKDFKEFKEVVNDFNPKKWKKGYGYLKEQYKKLQNRDKEFKGEIYNQIKRFLIYRYISNLFDIPIYKIKLCSVDKVIFEYGKYFIFLSVKPCLFNLSLSKIRELSKVKSNCSYMVNGQITRGKLKSSKKDRKLLREMYKELKKKYKIV